MDNQIINNNELAASVVMMSRSGDARTREPSVNQPHGRVTPPRV